MLRLQFYTYVDAYKGKLSPGVNFIDIFYLLFCTGRIRSFFRRTNLVNGEWRLTNFDVISTLTISWWNWTANFLPNAVRRHLFAWRTKFGEIDPRFIVGEYSKPRLPSLHWTGNKSKAVISILRWTHYFLFQLFYLIIWQEQFWYVIKFFRTIT